MTFDFIVQGVDCPSCANELAREIEKSFKELETADFDFNRMNLHLKFKEGFKADEKYLSKMAETICKLEPGTKVMTAEEAAEAAKKSIKGGKMQISLADLRKESGKACACGSCEDLSDDENSSKKAGSHEHTHAASHSGSHEHAEHAHTHEHAHAHTHEHAEHAHTHEHAGNAHAHKHAHKHGAAAENNIHAAEHCSCSDEHCDSCADEHDEGCECCNVDLYDPSSVIHADDENKSKWDALKDIMPPIEHFKPLFIGVLLFIIAFFRLGGRLFPSMHTINCLTCIISHRYCEHIVGYNLVDLIFFAASWLFMGKGVIDKGFKRMKQLRMPDENVLMTIAGITAFLTGFYEEAVAIMFFNRIGEILKNAATKHSKSKINSLIHCMPDKVRVLETDGSIVLKHPDDLSLDEEFVLLPGDRNPADAVILEGWSDCDLSAITGESLPVGKKEGDKLLAGSINMSGWLRLAPEKLPADSAMARIEKMVFDAENQKAASETFVSKFSAIYTPIMLLAALILAVKPLYIQAADWPQSVNSALMLIVIACPCAFVLSVPLAYFAGMGKASSEGIFIKGGDYLEKLSEVKEIFFDKTGTLTKAEFQLKSADYSGEEALENRMYAISYLLEAKSDHPLAKAYTDYIEAERKEDVLPLSEEYEIIDFSEVKGKGVKAILKNKAGEEIKAAAGKLHFAEEAAEAELNQKFKAKHQNSSESGICFAAQVKGKTTAIMAEFQDTIKEEAPEASVALKELGIKKLSMLTGDKAGAAAVIAEAAGIDDFAADLLPEEKLARITGEKDAFVGDGINDAPSLKKASVGISFSDASDVAAENADVIIVSGAGKLTLLPKALSIAKKTVFLAKENIAFSLIVKFIVLLAAIGGAQSVWPAVFADAGVAVLAVFNSLRVLNFDKKKSGKSAAEKKSNYHYTEA